jgi:hypothetical protein
MLPDALPFLCGEGIRLVKDAIRNVQLAQVVEEGPNAESFDLSGSKAESLSQIHRERGHSPRMTRRGGVFCLKRPE